MNENFDSVDAEYMVALYSALDEEYVEKCEYNRQHENQPTKIKGKKNERRSK